MAYNKVDADGKTLIDLTSDTVTADTLVSGRTAHLASGERVTGTFEPVTGVKGNAESTYRKGDVNLTPANIGAATSAQGTKADSAVQTIKMNGNAVTKTSGVVDLGTVITAHQNISGKADKSATVSTVTYDTTNKKLTKTINGTTTDVVTTAKLKTDMALSKSDVGLGNVGNFKAVSTVASQGLTDTEKANARTNIGAGTSSFSGSYNDLSNKPTIPTVNNGTLTIQKNGTTVATFTANQSGNSKANISVPTKVSELTNDSGYTTNTGTVTQVKVGSTAYNPSSGVITLPAYPTDTNTHRPIQLNGTEILGNNTTALNLKAGSNVNMSNSNGTVTINATDTNTTYSAGNGTTITGTNNAINVAYGTTANTACQGNDSRLSNARPASDVYSWAKAASKPTYTASEVGLGNVGNFKAVSTVASQGLSDTEKANARANIGAATTAQGTKADNAIQTVQVNGTTQTKTNNTVNISLDKSSVGLENVDNTSDLNKPISTAAQAALDSQQEQINYNTNNGVKNLLKITGVSATKNGVTFTVDKASGTITANGTATAPTSFDIYIDNSHSCPFNGYILTGCPTGGSGTTYDLRITDIDRTSVVDYGSGREISVTNTGKWGAAILIRDGQTVSNLVFKPMIRDASIEDDTFEPYAKSNVELTQKALLRDDNNDIITTDNDTRNITLEGSKIVIGANSSDSGAILIKENSGGGSIGIGNNRIQINSATRIGLNSSSISLLDTHGNLIQTSTANGIQLFADNITLGSINPCLSRRNDTIAMETDTHAFWITNDGSDPGIALSSVDGSQSIYMYQSGDIEILGKTINIQPDEIKINNIIIPYANNAGFHNSIYRGKYLGTSYTSAQKAQVQAGTFDDLFVGDYWLINNIHWRIAHCDYYLNTGDTATTAHHLVIVPDESLVGSYMNATDVTTGAYVGSYMNTTTLKQDGTEASDSVFGKIKAAFGEENLLSIRQLFANAVDSNGNVSGWAWYNTRCFLMNQCMVYGNKVWTNGNNDGYNVGIDKSQLALFAHNPTSINTKQRHWLRDVCSSAVFAYVGSYGFAGCFSASDVIGVRPVFLLKGA